MCTSTCCSHSNRKFGELRQQHGKERQVVIKLVQHPPNGAFNPQVKDRVRLFQVSK